MRPIRPEFGERLADFHPHRLQNLQVTPWRIERNDAGAIDRLDEGGRAAVHDRHFRSINLDGRVVDAERAEGGHQVLHRRHLRAGDADGGAQLGGADVTEIGGDGVGAAIAVGQPETQAAAGRRRMHGHGRLASAMDPDT